MTKHILSSIRLLVIVLLASPTATSAHPPSTTLPPQDDGFLQFFESTFFGFPAEGKEQGTNPKFDIAVRTQPLPDGTPNLKVRDLEGNARLTVKEYDLRFLKTGNAESLHKSLFTLLSDMQIVTKIQSDYRLNGAHSWLKSNAFSWSYQNQDRSLVGNLVISIRDTQAQSGIITVQHWESLVHPPD